MTETKTKWIAFTLLAFCCIVLHGLYKVSEAGLSLRTVYHISCGRLAQCLNHQYPVNLTDNVRTEVLSHGMSTDSSIEPTTNIIREELSLCPKDPPNLLGEVPLNKSYIPIPEFEQTLLEFVEKGGRSYPSDCMANHRVAIIVPFRDRHEHLAVLLRHLHPILHRQQLDYRIFVVEQTKHAMFNKGVLFNAGFLEISKRYRDFYQCIVLQDVDILPLNDKILYQCTDQPNHLSVHIDRYKFRYNPKATGGIVEVLTEQYREVNGFSNLFYGWGGEDDDFLCRLRAKNHDWMTNRMPWVKWGNLGHAHGKENPQRRGLIKSCERRQATDGLTSAEYILRGYHEMPLYTNVTIEIHNMTIYNGTKYQ